MKIILVSSRIPQNKFHKVILWSLEITSLWTLAPAALQGTGRF